MNDPGGQKQEPMSTEIFTPSWFYQLGLCLVHSPLLKTSLLFSIPSLIDMLKLWEFSYSFQIQLSIQRNLEYFEFFEIFTVPHFCWNTKILLNIFFLNFMFWHEYWNEYTNSFLCVCTFMHSKNHHSGRKRSWRFSQFSCVLPRLGNWDIRDIVFKSFPLKNFFKVDFWICKNQIECLN